MVLKSSHPPNGGAPHSGAELALACALLATLALVAAANTSPGMALWGMSVWKVLSLPWVVVGTAAGVVVLSLALSPEPPEASETPGTRRLARYGGWMCAALAGLVCAQFPDRTRFTGDFLLRLGAVSHPHELASVFPQAAPLDLATFVALPRALTEIAGLPPETAVRLLGIVLALGFGAAGWWFAQAMGLGHRGTLAIGLLVALQPALGLLTGYAKSLAALPLLTLIAATAALRAGRGGHGLVPLALATAAAIALHRSGLALLPLLFATLYLRTRDAFRAAQPAGPALIVAVAVPFLTLALTWSDTSEAIRRFDGRHVVPPGVAESGWWASLATGNRWADRANLTLLVAPLALLVPVLGLAHHRVIGGRRRREALLLGLALAPQLAGLALVQPQQGLFRDWDDFGAAGVMLTLSAAWLIAETLRPARRGRLAMAAGLLGAAVSAGWIAHASDPGRGRARIEAWLAGPPAPPPSAAASAWNFLAGRAAADERWEDCMRAYERSVRLAPNPRSYVEWGMAEARRGDPVQARALYARASALDSNLTNAWLGLASASSWLDDVETMTLAERHIARLAPGHPQLAGLAAYRERAARTRAQSQPLARPASPSRPSALLAAGAVQPSRARRKSGVSTDRASAIAAPPAEADERIFRDYTESLSGGAVSGESESESYEY